MVSPFDVSIEKRSSILRLTSAIRGAYPSVTLYWSAPTASSEKISSAIRRMSSAGNERGDGFPAAKLITDGSERDLNISRIADGFIDAIRSEKAYSMRCVSLHKIIIYFTTSIVNLQGAEVQICTANARRQCQTARR